MTRQPQEPQDPREPSGLPTLSDETVTRIEGAVFSEIAATRHHDLDAARHRRARRSRWWAAAGAAAAVVIVAAVIAPTVGGLVRGPSGASDSASDGGFVTTDAFTGMDSGPVDRAPESIQGAAGDVATDSGPTSDQGREVIATATATLEVAGEPGAAGEAADAVAAAAEAAGGYVESLSVDGSAAETGAGAEVVQGDMMTILPYPGTTGTWVSVRVPAAQLQTVMSDLDELGDVTASQISRQDVTTQAVDLRARVETAQASVTRLTELMAQAGSLADLIAAESALAERQAELESWQQQLEYLDDQVALSSLTVSIVTPTEAVEADPAGFGDGLVAGWNGLIATLNGIVIALGFLLPWLAVAAVVWLAVWLVLRGIRRRRPAPPPPAA
ncbi:DUF4349 domain-containing protein [Microbacterium sp. Sa4CUA7]|uniref:DUF4349 domain-containing protein n=1 Tax=Microbacterium pullorum TaxID=2762236 RepID=A0ABR8RZI1_9MICO|nr:DUF4349 domain-containing protein [Microbacterium pullorum]MBD7956647.1 DUF4349 domain-containing protein [Microbacterium pullorum]